MAFHFIASTGRTATTFIAAALDTIDGVAACHEGYRGSEHGDEPLLPLINLENALAFQKPESAAGVVSEKRSAKVVAAALEEAGAQVLVDVAYYNPTLATALLGEHENAAMVGIIRDCEKFVRSATQMEGEDDLPVGWPDPAKPLTDRERFISMGRIRPPRGSGEAASWKEWSAIRRNIWLWQATNDLILDAAESAPERSTILDFAMLKDDPDRFWGEIARTLRLPGVPVLSNSLTDRFVNRKKTGYQVGPAEEWSAEERSALAAASAAIEGRMKRWDSR